VTDRDLLRRALAGRVVAIVRLREGAALLEVAEALVAGGITTLEFTLTTPGAAEAIERCRARFGEAVVVGAGTVRDADDARRCLAAGAQFLVSPGFDPDVIAAARDGGALAMPGAMTPTEILAAWRAGADVVKVFPARALGPRYIADVLAPLPDVLLMPTGGVDATNAADYLRAGAVAVAVGGNLIDAAVVARADRALYDVKARGRDGVAVADPPVLPPLG
jgi:2-dehydro-3-deoxyphosphogluconate aldolase/(4S)-4-hydroxy-2-oxoglutarate aldolase